MLPEELIFQRHFQLWKYIIGHALLLLRSPKGRGFSTRIDVIFKNVVFIHLPSVIDNISIHEASKQEVETLSVRFELRISGDRKVFIVNGTNQHGYVIASTVAYKEDNGEYNDPSYFDGK